MPEQPSFFDSLSSFTAAVKDILSDRADRKGYARTKNRDGGRPMYDFVSDYIAGGSDAHALGEVVYKVARYQALKDPTELVKIASWAFLVWDAQQRRSAAEKTEG